MLFCFMMITAIEGITFSEEAQQKYFDTTPWLVDARLFESFLFDAPDDPLRLFSSSFKDTADSCRSFAELILKHAADADMLGDLFKNREEIICAFRRNVAQQASSPPLTEARASAS